MLLVNIASTSLQGSGPTASRRRRDVDEGAVCKSGTLGSTCLGCGHIGTTEPNFGSICTGGWHRW